MLLWIVSDLHIESCRWDLPQTRPDYDVLIAAGDIHSPASKGVEWLAARSGGKPVIYVPGNHEWYAPHRLFCVSDEAERARELAARLDVHFLMSESVTIDGVRFLGTTLWTDYGLNGDVRTGMMMAELYINDHRLIFPERDGHALSPEQAQARHCAERAWLERELAQLPAADSSWAKTVIVTHHMPHPRSIDAKYAGDALNPSFCSNLSGLVESSSAALWVHGHTHTSCDYVAGGVRIVCNPKGYGPRAARAPVENERFNPVCVVEV
jgi:Icc-related predicted phosphoesterase